MLLGSIGMGKSEGGWPGGVARMDMLVWKC